ncbi:MAG: hypothetical protein V3V33_16085 [Candidatus Lokiarchaeia archaeon]
MTNYIIMNRPTISDVSQSSKVHFENVGKISVREAFKNTDEDLQAMIKVRNKAL